MEHDGEQLAYRDVIVATPRQSGKSSLVLALIVYRMLATPHQRPKRRPRRPGPETAGASCYQHPSELTCSFARVAWVRQEDHFRRLCRVPKVHAPMASRVLECPDAR